ANSLSLRIKRAARFKGFAATLGSPLAGLAAGGFARILAAGGGALVPPSVRRPRPPFAGNFACQIEQSTLGVLPTDFSSRGQTRLAKFPWRGVTVRLCSPETPAVRRQFFASMAFRPVSSCTATARKLARAR